VVPHESRDRTVLLLHRGGPVVRGTEAVLIQSARAFAAAGYRLVVARSNACIDGAFSAITPQPEIIDFQFPELMIAGIGETSLPIPAYVKAFRRLKAIAGRSRPQFIYCSGGLPCQLGVPIGWRLRIPVICHFHHPAIRRALYLWLVRFADKLLFPSAFVREYSKRDLRDGGDVVYNGIDVQRFRPAPARDGRWRARLHIPADAIVIGQVGALAANKRPEFLISAFRSLLRATDRPLHLCLVGTGPMEGKLRRLVDDLGVAGNVTLTGYVEDVLPYYQHVFDVNVLVSMEEGLGISVIEGSACGLPAIVSNCTGLPETIVSNETGFLFEVNDEEGLRKHLVSLIEQPPLRAAMGRAGVAFAAERFSSVAYAENLMVSVHDMLGKRKVREVPAEAEH
jgi:glycosyltransferase involved in cell wall biosynthesis